MRFNSFDPNSRTSFFKCSNENFSQPIPPFIYTLIPSNNFGYYKNKITLQIYYQM